MDFLSLIPSPDTIPAPATLFMVLDILLFTVHILLINMILGSGLITIFSGFKKAGDSPENALHGPAVNKIPTFFALGINMGIAPLLFIQVIYGHLFYTSSVLMATYWIMVIPFLIIAYYGAYIHSRRYATPGFLSKSALWIMVLTILYIGFMLVNNNTLMLQPQKWTAYFDNRNGTILNLKDASLIPRYLHFVTASVAVGGLFLAILWRRKENKSVAGAAERVKASLEIFAWASIVQILTGCWFLISLPPNIMKNFMGGYLSSTLLLVIAILCALGAIFMALKGKLRPVISMIVITILAMIVNRQLLRSFYLEDVFHLDSLKLAPQYWVMTLFLFILVIGLAVVGYMLKISMKKDEGRA